MLLLQLHLDGLFFPAAQNGQLDEIPLFPGAHEGLQLLRIDEYLVVEFLDDVESLQPGLGRGAVGDGLLQGKIESVGQLKLLGHGRIEGNGIHSEKRNGLFFQLKIRDGAVTGFDDDSVDFQLLLVFGKRQGGHQEGGDYGQRDGFLFHVRLF